MSSNSQDSSKLTEANTDHLGMLEPNLPQLLPLAVAELRRNQPKPSLPLQLPAPLKLANSIEEATARFLQGDDSAAGTLYLIFAPQSDWDDAGGSQELGNQLCSLLHPHWVAAR